MSGRAEGAAAFLGLGGNIGDPQSAMAAALQSLDATAAVTVVNVSSLYRTPPWGKTDQPDFLNAVAAVRTSLLPRQLLETALRAETELKRVRAERWGPRIIDIDILWFDDRQIDEPGLQVPHPRMLERAFVMVPLSEIAPDLLLDGRTAADRAAKLDQAGMEKRRASANWWRANP